MDFRPLAALHVVAVEHAVAGPLCTRHLADLGATVTKIERLDGGDFAREYDSAVQGWSSYFVWLNQGKRSVALDIRSPAGKTILERLLRTADVFVSNLGPGVIDRLLDWPAIRSANSALIECVISGYGSSGPYAGRKAFDLLIQGEAGITRATGTTAIPAKAGVSVADLAGGSYAVTLILAALLERRRTGLGRRVEVSLFDVMVDWMTPLLLAEQYAGGAPAPAGMHHATIAPYGAYRTGDGELVNVAVQTADQWERFCDRVLQRPDLKDLIEYSTNERRVRVRDRLDQDIDAVFSLLSARELEARLEHADVPWGRVRRLGEVLSHPQLIERGRWVEVALGGNSGATGQVARLVASPLLTAQDSAIGRVPQLGENTTTVLREVGYDDEALQRFRDARVIPGDQGDGGQGTTRRDGE